MRMKLLKNDYEHYDKRMKLLKFDYDMRINE